MPDKQRHFKLYRESPAYQLFVSILMVAGVGIVSLIIMIIAGLIFFGTDLSVLEKSGEALGDSDSGFMRYLLIIQDISLFIIPSVIILVMMKPESEKKLNELKLPHLKEIGLVIVLAFCIFPVTSFTGQINSSMHLPDWLSGVERWMEEKEDYANSIINKALYSPSFVMMILNLFIIAVLPAIGEELFFRGVLQKILIKLFRSGHIAIWITAFIFSAIHFQFFGFVPRFILGLIFGLPVFVERHSMAAGHFTFY